MRADEHCTTQITSTVTKIRWQPSRCVQELLKQDSVRQTELNLLITIRLATCFDPAWSSSGLHYEPVNVRKLRKSFGMPTVLGSQGCTQLYNINLQAIFILCIGQTYRYSLQYAFYIFSQQIYYYFFKNFSHHLRLFLHKISCIS